MISESIHQSNIILYIIKNLKSTHLNNRKEVPVRETFLNLDSNCPCKEWIRNAKIKSKNIITTAASLMPDACSKSWRNQKIDLTSKLIRNIWFWIINLPIELMTLTDNNETSKQISNVNTQKLKRSSSLQKFKKHFRKLQESLNNTRSERNSCDLDSKYRTKKGIENANAKSTRLKLLSH